MSHGGSAGAVVVVVASSVVGGAVVVGTLVDGVAASVVEVVPVESGVV
ncbi:MAG TPA: hypothetical protein VK070_04790 [Acidimicrobiia bacterium]|nr:hypothetical protein [Acidimicrobiia bacterium]